MKMKGKQGLLILLYCCIVIVANAKCAIACPPNLSTHYALRNTKDVKLLDCAIVCPPSLNTHYGLRTTKDVKLLDCAIVCPPSLNTHYALRTTKDVKLLNCAIACPPSLNTQYAVRTTKKYHITVAPDGSGDFKTVQEAINAVPDFRKIATVIFIKNGIYKEKLNLSASKQMVKIIGESVEKTILTFDDYAQKKNTFGEDKGTSGSASFYIYGTGFSAENITFQNTAGPVGQAVALFVAGDKAKFINCRMLGFQDTLYTYGYASRQYYYKCYIEGTVDFIFGSSTAVFDDCEIFCKKAGYITASSSPDTSKYGYVFINSKIIGDAPENSYYLGRPWRPYAKAVFINCNLGKMIKPEGWDNWGKESNEKTAYYAEYKSIGAGANAKARVPWSHQLNETIIKEYTLAKIFNGWEPVE